MVLSWRWRHDGGGGGDDDDDDGDNDNDDDDDDVMMTTMSMTKLMAQYRIPDTDRVPLDLINWSIIAGE